MGYFLIITGSIIMVLAITAGLYGICKITTFDIGIFESVVIAIILTGLYNFYCWLKFT